MSDFVGRCNLKKDISNEKEIIKQMNLKLQNGTKEEIYFLGKNINLASNILQNKDKNEQISSIKLNDVIYTIAYNGRIYNKIEIKKDLEDLGYDFERIF